jgi:tRNA(Ile)-lysidine synthetase-like protein
MESGARYYRADLPLLMETLDHPIPLGRNLSINADWNFTAEIREMDENLFEGARRLPPYTAMVDADKSGSQIWLRQIHQGDRFRPSGLQGHSQKLSDILINQKVSYRLRAFYPLVWNQKEIIWVPGYRIAENVAITAATKRVLVMKFWPNEKAR